MAMAGTTSATRPLPDTTPAADLRGDGSTSSTATWERIRARVERQLAQIELHAHHVLETGRAPEDSTPAIDAARSLTNGFRQLDLPAPAALARRATDLLTRAPANVQTAIELASLTDDVRDLIAIAIAEVTTTDGEGLVLVVGPSTVQVDTTSWMLARRGHRIVHDASALPTLGEPPAAILVYLGPTADAANVARAARLAYPDAAVVGLHDAANVEIVAVVASSLHALVALDETPAAIGLEVDRAIALRRAQYTIVVSGDADDLRGRISTATVEPAPDGLDELLHSLQRPTTAFVIDDQFDTVGVLHLASTIRAVPRTRTTPIVSLGRHSRAERGRLAGYDVICAKPLEEWLPMVLERLRTAAAAAFTASTASGRGIHAWGAAQLLIDRALVGALRMSSPVSLALVKVPGDLPAAIRATLEETLEVEFRRNDIVGARGDGEYVVALQGAPRHIALQRLTEVATRLHFDEHHCRIGIAQLPQDGRSATELLIAADSVAERARQADGPAVTGSNWRPENETVADVLIVDPDEILTSVMRVALETRGLKAESLHNGHDAYERLFGLTTASLPRVIVLETDTPGIDGLQLLEHLRRASLLGRVRVLLLTSRSREADVRRALELGADDVVSKPFLTSLFVHRVTRMATA